MNSIRHSPASARLQLGMPRDQFSSSDRFTVSREAALRTWRRRPQAAETTGGGCRGASRTQEGARFLPAGLSNEETEFVVAAEQGLFAAAAALRTGAGRGAQLLIAPATLPDPQAHRTRGEGGRGALAALDHGPTLSQPRSGRRQGGCPEG